MKKLLVLGASLIIGLLLGALAGTELSFAPQASAQVSGSLWKLVSNVLFPVNSTWGLAVPSLANNNCIGTDSSGIFIAGTCSGGGGGSVGNWFTPHVGYNSTSTPIGFLAGLFTNGSTTIASLGSGTVNSNNGLLYSSATTTLVAGTNITFSGGPVSVIGSSPLTVNSTGGFSTTSADYYITATTTLPSITTLANLATVKTSLSGNLGANSGFLYTTGTSTPTVTAPITYSGTLGQFISGVSGAFGCTNASSGVTGCLTGTDWNTFNGKQAAGNYITALTGDVTASGPGSVAATLATVNSNVGSFTNASITVNGKGLITAASSGSGGTAASSTLLGDSNTFSGALNKFSNTISVASLNGLIGGNSGLFYAFASSSLFGFTPASNATTLTVAGTANQLTSSAGAQDLTTNRTWTLSLPQALQFPLSFTSTYGTTTFASSTALTATNLASTNATSTNLSLTGAAANCNGTNALTTNSTGVVGCTAQPQGTVTAVNGTANQITSSGGSTPTLSLPTHVIFPLEYFATNGSTTNATSTNLSVTGSSTLATLFGAGLGTCNSGSSALTWNAGLFGCNTISSTGSAYPFTPTINFGATSQATTGILWLQNGLQASSTSEIASTTFTIQGDELNGTTTLSQGCNIVSGVCVSKPVAGGNYTGFAAVGNPTGASSIQTILGSSNTLLGEVGTVSGHDFRVIVGNSDLIHLSNASKTVGINTTTATANRLEVKTAVSNGYFGVDNSSTGDVFEVNTTGVGVSSSTPWKLLSVGTGNNGTFAISTSTAGCATFSSLGELYSTGSACGTSSAYPFTPSTYGINTSATTTAIQDYAGLISATSTIGTVNATSSLTIAALTGLLKASSGLVTTATLGTDYVNGSGTSGHCVQWGTSNSLADSGSACGGSGSTPGGTQGAVQYNNNSTFGGANDFFVLSNGNVGIGSSTPTALFSVSATSTGYENEPILAVASSTSGLSTTTLFSINAPSNNSDLLDVLSLTGSAFMTIGNTGSTTIGGGSQITGLTTNGGATTTGNQYVGGTAIYGNVNYSALKMPSWTVSTNPGSDFTTIQPALDACGASGGGTIVLTDSLYAQGGTGLLFKGSNCHIEGRGVGTSTITFTGATTLFKTNSAVGAYSNESISGITVTADGNAAGVVLDLSDMSHGVYEHLKIDNVGTAFRMNDTQNKTFYNIVRDITATTLQSFGINASSTRPANDNMFENSFFGCVTGTASGCIAVNLNNNQADSFYNITAEPTGTAGTQCVQIRSSSLATNNGTFSNIFYNFYCEANQMGVFASSTDNRAGLAPVFGNNFYGGQIETNTTNIANQAADGYEDDFYGTGIQFAQVNNLTTAQFVSQNHGTILTLSDQGFSNSAFTITNNTSFSHNSLDYVKMTLLNTSDSSNMLNLQNNGSGATLIATSTRGTDFILQGTNGFVGIGTTTPWALFSINPGTNIGTSPMFAVGSSTKSFFVIDSQGRAVFGSTTPLTTAGLTLATSTVMTGAQFSESISSTTPSAASYTLNWESGNNQRFILNQNTTFIINATSSNPRDGAAYTLKLCQDTTGSRTATFATPGQLIWEGGNGATTTVASAAGSVTMIGMLYDARTSRYDVVASTTKSGDTRACQP